MPLKSRIARRILSSLCVLLVAGCGPSVTPNSTAEKPKQTKKKLDLRAELPGAVTGAGWHIPWRVPDPKHPGGPAIPVLIADAEHGALQDEGNNPTIQLSQVRAEVYQEGQHSADIKAARIAANQRERTIHGTGGVVVSSLTNPPDTVLTAATIDWNTRSSVIEAVGHTHVVSHSSDGSPDTTLTADLIQWDMKSHSIVAVGHAHVLSQPHGGTPIEQSGGKITFDIARKQFKIE